MSDTYFATIQFDGGGSRTFVFVADSDSEAKVFAEGLAEGWLPDDCSVVDWGFANDFVGFDVLELCTF